jgi:hypothetical protein
MRTCGQCKWYRPTPPTKARPGKIGKCVWPQFNKAPFNLKKEVYLQTVVYDPTPRLVEEGERDYCECWEGKKGINFAPPKEKELEDE